MRVLDFVKSRRISTNKNTAFNMLLSIISFIKYAFDITSYIDCSCIRHKIVIFSHYSQLMIYRLVAKSLTKSITFGHRQDSE